MQNHSPYLVPQEPGRWRAIALAAVVHFALLAFLWIGVQWQSKVPVAVEAEVWSMDAKEAAPPAPTPPPVLQPEPVTPEPLPEPKPVIAPPPPKVVEQPVVPDPEIALAKERKRKELEQKKLDQEEQDRKDKALQQEQQRKEDELAKKEKAKKDTADAKAEKQKEDDAKKKADAAEAKLKAAADAKQKQKLDAAKKAEAAADQAQHDATMKKLLGQASGNGAANSTGTAAKSQGPKGGDPGYASKVGAKIRNNINFNAPDDVSGNPAAEFDVQLLPDGSISSIRLKKPSGVPGFDEAVKRAIERSAPYPKDNSGTVPSGFTGIHRLKDQ
ncbi:cell envelope integrity protein TolA [Glaciimonas sp. GS1]|uniref:Cell envelope integrity protein TolA n=1 Tax=Glaciimonas soli TaxID=2590999 RepID=A0A843YTW3_9BURK|nr:cell envelope integrity protein TolA [Glaciimonas soli]